MSTHRRLACAVLALVLALPAAAAAETGGTTYGATKTSATSPSHSSKSSKSSRSAHLGGRVPVRRGMRGHDVKILQDFFNRIGMRMGRDGVFGRATWKAERRFEKRAGRPVDGVLDAKDLAVLRKVVGAGSWKAYLRRHGSPKARSAHLGDRVPVRRGMKGHDVKILQDFINRIGMHISIDGAFGRGTWRALRRFEKRAGRPVDGVLDASDLSALRKVIGAGGWPQEDTPAQPAELPPGSKAKVNSDGTASVPSDAPDAVKAIIAAGNEIATKPYRYGGGHGRWKDSGYDCSGSISYALHGGGLLDSSLDSTGFESWGAKNAGQWVTVYANAGHAYMVVAGLRFDTSGRSKAGTRWQADMRSSKGYVVRHPDGL